MWLPSALKESMKDELISAANELGINGEEFVSKIADEKCATTEEEVVEYITANGHPALTMESMF